MVSGWAVVARMRPCRGWWLVWWWWRDGQYTAVVTRTSQLPAPAPARARPLPLVWPPYRLVVVAVCVTSPASPSTITHQPRLIQRWEPALATCQEQPLGQVLIWLIRHPVKTHCQLLYLWNFQLVLIMIKGKQTTVEWLKKAHISWIIYANNTDCDTFIYS